MAENIFQDLESRVETLVNNSRKLKDENAFLREMIQELETERDEWREKHAQTRQRIEQVIVHLKSMDVADELQ